MASSSVCTISISASGQTLSASISANSGYQLGTVDHWAWYKSGSSTALFSGDAGSTSSSYTASSAGTYYCQCAYTYSYATYSTSYKSTVVSRGENILYSEDDTVTLCKGAHFSTGAYTFDSCMTGTLAECVAAGYHYMESSDTECYYISVSTITRYKLEAVTTTTWVDGGEVYTKSAEVTIEEVTGTGAVYLYTGSAYKAATVYINTDGTSSGWKQATPFIWDGSSWRQCTT